MALDKILALSGPPGHSLTDTPNKWQWEKPTEFSNPDDAIDFVVEGLEKETTKQDITRMMAAGITVEELVNQVALKGFMEGYYTPDVAELIKPALAIYLLGIADDAGFMPVVFAEGTPDGKPVGEVDEQTFFEILKERNPELFSIMLEEENENERLATAVKMERQQELESPVSAIETSQSFLDVPEDVAMQPISEQEKTLQQEEII